MEQERVFTCAHGCGKQVRGIYCDEARAERAAQAAAARAEKSERLKELWATRREELLAAIAAGKAPAQEGA
jgi:hypothetical protein